MKRKPYNAGDLVDIGVALLRLKDARFYLRRAGALKSVAKVESAIKSVGGAERHAYLRQFDDRPSISEDNVSLPESNP